MTVTLHKPSRGAMTRRRGKGGNDACAGMRIDVVSFAAVRGNVIQHTLGVKRILEFEHNCNLSTKRTIQLNACAHQVVTRRILASLIDTKMAKHGCVCILNWPRCHAELSVSEGEVVDMLTQALPGAAVLRPFQPPVA